MNELVDFRKHHRIVQISKKINVNPEGIEFSLYQPNLTKVGKDWARCSMRLGLVEIYKQDDSPCK